MRGCPFEFKILQLGSSSKSSKVSSFEGSCSLTFDSAHSVAAKMVGRGELGRLSRRSRAPACHHPKTATGQCKNPAYKNLTTDIRKGLKQESKIAGKKVRGGATWGLATGYARILGTFFHNSRPKPISLSAADFLIFSLLWSIDACHTLICVIIEGAVCKNRLNLSNLSVFSLWPAN